MSRAEQNGLTARPRAEASILIVVDQPSTAQGLTECLSEANHRVDVAESAEQAIARLVEAQYKVMVWDAYLPGLTGSELLWLARALDPHMAVAVLGNEEAFGSEHPLRSHVLYDHVRPPVDRALFPERIASLIENRKDVLRRNAIPDFKETLEESELRTRLQASLQSLCSTLEAKDENTRNHSSRVARLSLALAQLLRPHDTAFHETLRVGTLLHDIGKVTTPASILSKPGKLTPEEFDQIKKHTVNGELILRSLIVDEAILSIVRHHHERWDGEGYPDGLKAEEINLGARITAVADSYDAITSNRPYRLGRPSEEAFAIILGGAGTQWDQTVVDALCEVARQTDITSFMRDSSDPPPIARPQTPPARAAA